MNSGTPESNYGYWYPGEENDGGAGGGFEPAPYGNAWLETDRFAREKPIRLTQSLGEIRFDVESDNPAAHVTRLSLRGSAAARYVIRGAGEEFRARTGNDDAIEVDLPITGPLTSVHIERADG